MGFKYVYQMLADVFPQVDARILKAVAIENSKNTEAAIEIVLSEIIPYLSQRSMISNATKVNENCAAVLSDGEAEQSETGLVRRRSFDSEKTGMKNVEGIPMGRKHVCRNDVGTSANHAGKERILDQTADLSVEANVDREQFKGSVESDVLLENPQRQFNNSQVRTSETSKIMTEALIRADVERQVAPLSHEFQDAMTSFEHEVEDDKTNFEHKPAQSDQTNNLMQENGDRVEWITFGESSGHELAQSDLTNLIQENGDRVKWNNFGESSGDELDLSDLRKYIQENGDHLEWVNFEESSRPELAQSDLTNLMQEIDGIYRNVEQTAEDATVVSPQGVANCKNVVTNHVDKTVLLEELIEGAKNNKKTLFLAMELVMNMMMKVELEEREAELAKEEASRGRMDILKKVEDLKPLLEHANEANNMHAGEVAGEKAILATEVRELQTRLLSLSNERDSGLAVLDKMRQTLEERLTMAAELKRLAEEEKQEKEEAALKLLAEQQVIMEKVVQESKILQQEAEENSKLREFLMDRGRVVDTLQGEISVICQDVRLLKEKFDDRVPLSQSISSSQTSCILASSGTSHKSIASDRQTFKSSKSASETSSLSGSVDGVLEKRMLDEGNASSSVGGISPKKHFEGANAADNRELMDDEGWELCD